MERALVTGATGFIGQALVSALLARGVHVTVFARAPRPTAWDAKVTWRLGDIEKPESLAGVCDGIDSVFHLAGYAHATDAADAADAQRHHRVTVAGTAALLDRARTAGVGRFLFVSSVKAMGELTDGDADETAASPPLSAYGRAKRAAELAVLEAGGRWRMHACVLRLPMVYGAGFLGNLPRMIHAIDRGWFPPLPRVDHRRSLVHVLDVVQALLLAAESAQASGQVYLVTDGKAVTARELYDLIRAALGKPRRRWSVPLPLLKLGGKVGDRIGTLRGRPFVFDSTTLAKLLGNASYRDEKIRRELGYRPRYDLPLALGAIIEDYRQGAASPRAKEI